MKDVEMIMMREILEVRQEGAYNLGVGLFLDVSIH